MHLTRLYREQHARIRTFCEPLLSQTRATDSFPAVRSALARLAGALKHHLRDEDERLYPYLLEHGDLAIGELARRFCETMGGLSSQFVAFYDRWIPAGAIEAETKQFFAETDFMLGAILQRIDTEDAELYPAVDRARA